MQYLVLLLLLSSNIHATFKHDKDRPDLTVEYFTVNTTTNDKDKLLFAESLHKVGRYYESLGISYQLLLSKMSYYDRGKNYFNLAQNYAEIGKIDKAREYFQKAITRNNQYYFYKYAQFEEYQKNFTESIPLYQKALNHKYGEKDYIVNAYIRAVNSALIHYKNRDKSLYNHYLSLINTPRTQIISKALILP